ncbi:MAG: 30S ribosomal protein S20 [Deltaproteobacteria bacterium]|nr:30S ribosomal protein S20 [Deltaproteobacteria bacterium]
MANHKSALKRAKQNVSRRLRNRALKSTLKTEIKKFIDLITQNKFDDAKNFLPHIHKMIDKAQTKGILKKETASRKKSRMSLMLNKTIKQA